MLVFPLPPVLANATEGYLVYNAGRSPASLLILGQEEPLMPGEVAYSELPPEDKRGGHLFLLPVPAIQSGIASISPGPCSPGGNQATPLKLFGGVWALVLEEESPTLYQAVDGYGEEWCAFSRRPPKEWKPVRKIDLGNIISLDSVDTLSFSFLGGLEFLALQKGEEVYAVIPTSEHRRAKRRFRVHGPFPGKDPHLLNIGIFGVPEDLFLFYLSRGGSYILGRKLSEGFSREYVIAHLPSRGEKLHIALFPYNYILLVQGEGSPVPYVAYSSETFPVSAYEETFYKPSVEGLGELSLTNLVRQADLASREELSASVLADGLSAVPKPLVQESLFSEEGSIAPTMAPMDWVSVKTRVLVQRVREAGSSPLSPIVGATERVDLKGHIRLLRFLGRDGIYLEAHLTGPERITISEAPEN